MIQMQNKKVLELKTKLQNDTKDRNYKRKDFYKNKGEKYTQIKIIGQNSEDIQKIVSTLNNIKKLRKIVSVGPTVLPRIDVRVNIRDSPDGDGNTSFTKFEKSRFKILFKIINNIHLIEILKEINSFKFKSTFVFVKIGTIPY